jgi:site-specific DNA recombinase
MPILIALLKDYASGKYSLREVADHLNSLGYRTRNGSLFTGYAIKDVLHNRFYEGKVIFHKGLSDEQIVEGSHEVSPEIRELWKRCQDIKDERSIGTRGQPCNLERHYPFSRILRCQHCHQPYYGEAIKLPKRVDLRLVHERHTSGRNCDTWPRSQSIEEISQQFQGRVLRYLILPDSWETAILAAMRQEEEPVDKTQIQRIERAVENLRKQHLWGDLSDEEYRQERIALERQIKLVSPSSQPKQLPNLERASELIKNMPALWSHPGVTDEQRESLIKELFVQIEIDGDKITSIEPKSNYAPLFATIAQQYGYCGGESPPSPP